MTDKKVKELANEILQGYFFDYVEVDETFAIEKIRKYIPKDTVLVSLDQYHKWQSEMCEMKSEIVRLNQTITPAKIRKETASEILAMFDDRNIITWDELKSQIAKRYGVKSDD